MTRESTDVGEEMGQRVIEPEDIRLKEARFYEARLESWSASAEFPQPLISPFEVPPGITSYTMTELVKGGIGPDPSCSS